MAPLVALHVTWKQMGPRAINRGQTPDVHALDQVPGISRTYLHASHKKEVERHTASVEADGEITLQRRATSASADLSYGA